MVRSGSSPFRRPIADAFGQNNQEIWDALIPALQIASNVLRSNPPYWLAFLNFTRTLRKVPVDRDGRTRAEKEEDSYRQYRSIWPEHRDTNWEEYDSASLLNSLNFDSAKATYALLRRGERDLVLP